VKVDFMFQLSKTILHFGILRGITDIIPIF